MSRYWQIDFSCADPDEQSWELIEHGADGVELLAGGAVRAFFRGADPSDLIRNAQSLGFIVVSQTFLEDQNWVESCRELYAPLEVGKLRIVPITDIGEHIPDEDCSRDITIIPGQGFGTGHHATTQQVLLLLQERGAEAAPKRVLDLGTGSGILAIACVKLFDAEVLAIDISEDALANARENSARNGCADRVRCSLPCSWGAEPFDLVVANVYAEILIAKEPELRSALKSGGLLLTAGILEDLAPDFLAAYRAPHWEVIEREKQAEWSAFALRRAELGSN